MGSDTSALWQKFCRNLEIAGDAVLGADLAVGKLDEAEGVRYLTRLLRIGLEMHLENADPAFPQFYQASHETAKIGADNPDNFYQNATISGDYSYIITGQRGTVPILSFGTKANRYAIDGTMASTGELDIRDIKVGADGHFKITVSKDEVDGNWLPMEDDSSMLIVRQTFFDKAEEKPAYVKIKTINGPDYPPYQNLGKISQSLENATNFVSGTSRLFVNWAKLFRQENRNALNTTDQTIFVRAGGDPMIHYLHGWWDLAPDEALEITSPIPVCEGWNFQLNNIWMESLDYRYHRIHHNNNTAKPNADGSVSLSVSPVQRGKNWIDTAGHSSGTMLWRWTGANEFPVPTVTVIKQE